MADPHRDPGEPGPDEPDRDAVERAFAELVAGYHLTSDRPDPLPPTPSPAPAPPATATGGATRVGWADDHPLFAGDAPEPADDRGGDGEEPFVPPPAPPLPRPAWPALLGWLGMGYALLAMLAVVVGIRIPGWLGWLALAGFVGGFGLLVLRLPRSRSPEDGDGAVV